MNNLDEQIEALTTLLRAQGAIVDIDPNAPDYVKQAWLNLILNCSECKEEMTGKWTGVETN